MPASPHAACTTSAPGRCRASLQCSPGRHARPRHTRADRPVLRRQGRPARLTPACRWCCTAAWPRTLTAPPCDWLAAYVLCCLLGNRLVTGCGLPPVVDVCYFWVRLRVQCPSGASTAGTAGSAVSGTLTVIKDAKLCPPQVRTARRPITRFLTPTRLWGGSRRRRRHGRRWSGLGQVSAVLLEQPGA